MFRPGPVTHDVLAQMAALRRRVEQLEGRSVSFGVESSQGVDQGTFELRGAVNHDVLQMVLFNAADPKTNFDGGDVYLGPTNEAGKATGEPVVIPDGSGVA